MIISIGKILLLCVVISSCSRPHTKEWTIPLYSADASLEILLPNDFSAMKTSVHRSDCETCGMFHTILADNDFLNKVEDTTGFFTPWLTDTTAISIFYIEEQLHPDISDTIIPLDYQEILDFVVQSLKWENSKTKVHRQEANDDMALMSYETVDIDGRTSSKRIECRTHVDKRFVTIRYIQYRNFERGAFELVWNGIKGMEIKKN